MAAKTRWLMPGWSGTPLSEIRASSRPRAAPHTTTSRIHSASGTIHVPSASLNDERTGIGTSNVLPNSILREGMTPAPTLAEKFDVPIHGGASFSDAEGTWIVP